MFRLFLLVYANVLVRLMSRRTFSGLGFPGLYRLNASNLAGQHMPAGFLEEASTLQNLQVLLCMYIYIYLQAAVEATAFVIIPAKF